MGQSLGKNGSFLGDDDEEGGVRVRPIPGGNPINHIQVLRGHNNIVRHIVRLDETHMATAGDDGAILLWDYGRGLRTGAVVVRREGGVGALIKITALVKVPIEGATLLACGASDKAVRVYDYMTLELRGCVQTHAGSVTSLVFLQPRVPEGAAESPVSGSAPAQQQQQQQQQQQRRMVSGANDELLAMWTVDARGSVALEASVKREEQENLHCMLSLPGERVATGSDSKLIMVYCFRTGAMVRALYGHRESVRSLAPVSSSAFASGSLDGVICVWSTADTLDRLHILNLQENYFDRAKGFMLAVNKLLLIDQRYLGAALGAGFAVFDIQTGRKLISRPNAHSTSCVDLLCLHHGQHLATCSSDGLVRLWSLDDETDAASSGSGKSPRRGTMPGGAFVGSPPAGGGLRSPAPGQGDNPPPPTGAGPLAAGSLAAKAGRVVPVMVPACIASMPAHSEPVLVITALSDNDFASASADGTIILWRDGRILTSKRNTAALQQLIRSNTVNVDVMSST
jgi:WD40 repeat protein